MKRAFTLALGFLVVASWAVAHDFWLVAVGDEIEARTGSHFPVSTNAVDPGRLAEAVAVSREGRKPLTVMGMRGTVLTLKADPAISGTFWAAVALHPRRIELTAAEFNEYVLHDGLPQIHALREARGELERSAVERYQKFAKALVVRPGTGGLGGAGGGSVALQAVGHRFELVPLADPGTLSSGDTLGVAVRFENRSMAGLTVNAGYEGQPDSTHAFTAVSDSAGRVRVPVSRAGLWYVRTIHMREVHDPPYQWESFWASLTFTAR